VRDLLFSIIVLLGAIVEYRGGSAFGVFTLLWVCVIAEKQNQYETQ